MEATYSFQVLSTTVRLCTVVLLGNLELCKGAKSHFCSAKNNQELKNIRLFFIKIDRSKMDRNATMNLDFFLFCKRSASVKYTTVAGVKLRLFRVYIESLTMSSQEPPKKKRPNERADYFVCTANAHACVSCILCQDTPARTIIWKNTRLIMALNHK